MSRHTVTGQDNWTRRSRTAAQRANMGSFVEAKSYAGSVLTVIIFVGCFVVAAVLGGL